MKPAVYLRFKDCPPAIRESVLSHLRNEGIGAVDTVPAPLALVIHYLKALDSDSAFADDRTLFLCEFDNSIPPKEQERLTALSEDTENARVILLADPLRVSPAELGKIEGHVVDYMKSLE